MATKVFISWSGPLTQKIAAELNGWIPKMLQSVQTYFTPDDIEKGAHWSNSIEKELSQSEIGILCLTQDNQVSPWITFEAGALSKHKDVSRVCPLLFNFDNADLTGPLTIFQTTKFEKNEFKKLMSSINNCSEKRLEDKNFDETFEVWWPHLEAKISQILAEEEVMTTPQKRDQQDILEEILELVRSNSYSPLRQEYRETIAEIVDALTILRDRMIVRGSIKVLPEFRNVMAGVRRLCYDTGNAELYNRLNYSISMSDDYLVREDKKMIFGTSFEKDKNEIISKRNGKLE